MQVTRKGFITSVATALAAAAALPTAEVFASLPRDAALPSAEAFSAQIGSSFVMYRANGSRVGAVLRLVVNATSHPGTEQFSLYLQTKRGAALPEGDYWARHTKLGSLSLYVIPTPDPSLLRADFNLLRQ